MSNDTRFRLNGTAEMNFQSFAQFQHLPELRKSPVVAGDADTLRLQLLLVVDDDDFAFELLQTQFSSGRTASDLSLMTAAYLGHCWEDALGGACCPFGRRKRAATFS
jgi:hypothetical protein